MKKRNSITNVVIHSEKKSDDIKILIPLIVTLVLAGVVLAVTAITVKNKTNSTTVPQSQSTNAPAQSNYSTQAPIMQTTVKEKITPDGDGLVFAVGKYYLEGSLFTNSSSNGISVSVSADGKNSEIATVYKQMWLGVMNINDKKYLVDLGSKAYIEYTPSALVVLKTDSLLFDIQLPSDISTLDYIKNTADINGEKGNSYVATDGNRTYEIITLNSELKQITVVDSQNNSYRIIVENITSAIPEDRLSLDNLFESSSMFSFFSAITN